MKKINPVKVEICKKEIPVTTYKTVKSYNVPITQEQAEALVWVLGRVGGDPEKTPRGLVEAIYTGLLAAGVQSVKWESDRCQSALYFQNPREED